MQGMEVVTFAILVAQVAQVLYQLIAQHVLTIRLHSEYLTQINAYAKISTLMISKIKFAKPVQQLVTLARIHRITVWYAKVAKIEYSLGSSANA